MIGMRERRSWDKHGVRSIHRLAHRVPYGLVVTMSLEVDAAEREPARAGTEKRTCDAILLPTRTTRLALGCETGSPIPSRCRGVRAGDRARAP